MAFGKISKALAVPVGATASYVFERLAPSPMGGFPTLTMRHVGDGTPGYKRASWHAANAARARSGGTSISEAKTKQRALDDARLIAEHCTVSWSNVVEDDGQIAPCTPDKVFEFFTAIIEADDGLPVYTAFRAWASDADTFRASPQGDVVELGKA